MDFWLYITFFKETKIKDSLTKPLSSKEKAKKKSLNSLSLFYHSVEMLDLSPHKNGQHVEKLIRTQNNIFFFFLKQF